MECRPLWCICSVEMVRRNEGRQAPSSRQWSHVSRHDGKVPINPVSGWRTSYLNSQPRWSLRAISEKWLLLPGGSAGLPFLMREGSCSPLLPSLPSRTQPSPPRPHGLGTGETNWLISLTWLLCKGYSQRYPAGPQLQSGYLSKWVKIIRGLWRNTYSYVGEGQRLWPKDSIQLNTSICPLEKCDPHSRINSWLTVSYSAETTNFCLPRTLPIVMMPKSLATSILLPALVLRSPCAANYDKVR